MAEGDIIYMAGPWDSVMKKLLRTHPEHFVNWLLPDAEFVSLEDVELQQQHRFADGLMIVKKRDRRGLIHTEVQTYFDPEIGKRLQEYNMMAWSQYDLPVSTYVICLVKAANIPDPPYFRRFIEEEEVHRFFYHPVRMWQKKAETFFGRDRLGVTALATLAKDGKRPEVVQAMIEQLAAAKAYDLLAMAQVIGGLAFKKGPEREAFRKRFGMFQDVISESWVYQEIEEEGLRKGWERGLEQGQKQGLEQGQKQGLEQGQKQGLEKGLHQTLLIFMEARYPTLVALAQKQTSFITGPTILNQILSKVFALQTTEEVEQYLKTLGNDSAKN